MNLSTYDDLTENFTQYGNIAIYDQVEGPYTLHYFSTILNEHTTISLSIRDPRDCLHIMKYNL